MRSTPLELGIACCAALLAATGCGGPMSGPDATSDATSGPDAPGADVFVDSAPDVVEQDNVVADAVVEDAAAADSGACPAGLGARWACEGTTGRARCVGGAVERVPCAYGCADRAGGDAVCSCGTMSNFTVWNCLPSGDLGRCSSGAWLEQSCMGRGCVAMPAGVDDVCRAPSTTSSLQMVLDRLGPTCAAISNGTRCAIAVRDLATGERASYRGAERFQSASSAKAIWVAAAVLDRGTAAVEPLATPVFRDSSNDAAGSVIDLLSSPDRVNAFYRGEAGMTNSSLCRWNTGGRTRQPSNCVPWSGASNYFTADDATEFLSRLGQGRIFGEPRLSVMLRWMTLSPRTGSPGGVLGTQLPAAARATMQHKAGWIPDLGNHNDIGLVEYAPGRFYAVSILATGTASNFWLRQSPWIEYASCVIFHGVTRGVTDPFTACRRP
ncbi:MAG: serine hydrolase [Myxococcales bacterium]|nr:serine hydrolase [Myxococcales bacterium]